MRFRRSLGLVRGAERYEGDPGKRGAAASRGGSARGESRGEGSSLRPPRHRAAFPRDSTFFPRQTSGDGRSPKPRVGQLKNRRQLGGSRYSSIVNSINWQYRLLRTLIFDCRRSTLRGTPFADLPLMQISPFPNEYILLRYECLI